MTRWRMASLPGTALLVVLSASAAAAPSKERLEYRSWTDRGGSYRVEAALIGVDTGGVRLRKRDGTSLTVPLERLNEADQRYVERNSKP